MESVGVTTAYPFPTLPDYLGPHLRVVFVGINPGLFSVDRGHYFARPTNRFWPAFSRSSLSAPARAALGRAVLEPADDRRLLRFGIGFTDVVKVPSRNASALRPRDFQTWAPRLRRRLARCRPRVACFHGVTAYRAFTRYALRDARTDWPLGEQALTLDGTRLFVVPNPSPANAHFRIEDQVRWYDRLAAFLDRLARGARRAGPAPPAVRREGPRRVPNQWSVPIGAHVSVSGHLYDAIPRAQAIGCECLQIFVGSPRQWRLVAYPAADLAEFRTRRRAARLDPLVAHAPYLVNLAAPDRALHRRSVAALAHTLRGMDALDGYAAITHVGSAPGVPWPETRRRIAGAVRTVLRASTRARLLLEGSAGATLGGRFEELREILDEVGPSRRLGVCLDTAHLFAAGWDLRTADGVAATVDAFARIVGLRHLRVLHLNDSKGALGSHVDRHANIGEGWIGRRGFRAVLAHPALRGLPAVIETPGFAHTGPDRRNIAILKRLRASALRARSRP